jgi:hypothetical protein
MGEEKYCWAVQKKIFDKIMAENLVCLTSLKSTNSRKAK